VFSAPRVILAIVSASQNLIERARVAGLSPALAEALERELAPRIDYVLASVPELPPAANEETRILTGLVEAYRPYLPLLLRALDKLIDAISASLDDLFDQALQDDPRKRRSLHHLEEALASLIRVSTATAALLVHHPELGGRALPWTMDVAELPEELRPYLRGLLATLVGLERIEGDVTRLAPWAWMARRETLKSEGLVMVALRELGSAPFSRPRRVPGGWKGRVHIAEDFDAPLPKELEDSFYGDAGSDR
jgi:hypothetical protein